VVLLGVALSFWSFRQISNAAEERTHTDVVIKSAGDFLSALKDAETGQRGYLLTGDEAFLEPYLQVRDRVNGHLEELRQFTLIGAAQKHLDALAPLVHADLVELSRVIELRRRQNMAAVSTVENLGHGKRLMDSIRAEMADFIQIEENARAQYDAEFRSGMGRLFTVLASASLLVLLLALSFAYLIHREAQHRLKEQVHMETQHLLGIQAATNQQLQQANVTLQISEERLAVTLNSIGDAVIATDAQGRVTRLNPLAQQLTGWTQAQATGRPVGEIFHIINQETRQPAIVPVMETLAKGTIHGLANHTLLIALGGSECAIADSCAPIRDREGQVVGVVLVFRDVTKEHAAHQALIDNTTLIQTILNTVVDGIITLHASDGIVETVNPSAERMFGYSAAELIGQNFSLLIPEFDRGQPNSSLEYYSAGDKARAIGLGREVAGRRKDGSTFPMEMTLSEMRLGSQNHFTGVLRDVTARKQAEAALLKGGALQNAIFKSANFSCIATDAKGVIQIFNVGAERMMGYTTAEVVNQITPAKLHDSQEVIARAAALSLEYKTPIAPGFEALAFKASRGIEDIYELTKVRKDGSRFPAVVSVTALRDAEAGIIGYLLIGTDNTARHEVEQERKRFRHALQETNVNLEIAKSAAEKANLAKSDFLSSMSHELRTPLNAILGFAQLMESSSPPPTDSQAKSIARILHAGWYLLNLINEILDLAVIESGKVSLSKEAVSLSEVMTECRSMMGPQAQKRGIRMILPEFGSPLFVNADRIRLKQIIINLVSNAIKYNKDQGTVEVGYTMCSPGRIRLNVRDTGAGMSPEQLSQLFQPFNRLGKEASTVAGTGIGLVVSKRLAELMGAVIGVESTVGVGSVFWCELSLMEAPQVISRTGKTETLAQLEAPASASQRTVLYVEDNPANMELVEELVARFPNIALITAADGILGIKLARSAQPEVILMDINLPGISGVKALKILREDPATEHIPVIALSANAMPRDVAKGLQAGFFHYLTKPIKIKEFMDTLGAALEFAEEPVVQIN